MLSTWEWETTKLNGPTFFVSSSRTPLKSCAEIDMRQVFTYKKLILINIIYFLVHVRFNSKNCKYALFTDTAIFNAVIAAVPWKFKVVWNAETTESSNTGSKFFFQLVKILAF